MSEQDGKIVNLGGLKKFKEYYDTDIITPINNKIDSKTNVQSGEIITTNNDTIGYFKDIKINGNTRYKKSDKTYTDTWESGVSLESVGEAEKNSDGKYPIEVFSCNGENLMRGTVFEKSHADYTLEDGRYTVSGDSTLNWAHVSFVIDNLVVGAEYVCSCFIESSGNRSGIVQLVDGNNKTLIFTRYATGNVGESFIATSPTMYLRLFANNDEYSGVKRYSNVIVSKKHNKRTILLDSPLRKVGTIADVLDLEKKEVTRNCKTAIFDGSSDENWTYAGNNIFALPFTGYKKVDLTTNSLLMCDKFTVTSHNVLNNISGNYIAFESSYTSDNYLRIRKPDATDLATFTTWLQSNHVTVVYQLATPTTEDIDVSSNTLTDFATSCTLTIDNTIKGNIECNEVVGLIPSVEEDRTRLTNLETDNTTNKSNITNLQKSLENKAEKAHNHTIADVTNLQTTLDKKAPINYVSQFEGGAISSNFRKTIIGTTDMCGFAKSFRKNDSTDACMPQNGSGIAWGQADTHGMLYVDWSSSTAYVAGGNGNRLNWYKQLAWKDDLTSYSLKTHTHDYLPLSGGTMTGNITLPKGTKITTTSQGGYTLLEETDSSVNIGFVTKGVNLTGSAGYVNGSRILTKDNSNYAEVLFMGTTGGTTRKNVSSCMKITTSSDKYYPVFTAPSDGVYLFMAWGSVSNILAVNKQQLCSSSQQSGVKPLYLSKSDEAVFCLWFSDTSNSGLPSGIDIVVMKIN